MMRRTNLLTAGFFCLIFLTMGGLGSATSQSGNAESPGWKKMDLPTIRVVLISQRSVTIKNVFAVEFKRLPSGGQQIDVVGVGPESHWTHDMAEIATLFFECHGSPDVTGTGDTSGTGEGYPVGADRLGQEWSVTEAVTYTGHWVRRGNSEVWDATWNNGAVAVLNITIAADKVRISRKDVAGPSPGFTSIYEGTLAPDGTVQGIETATWPGHFTNRTFQWQGRIVK